MNAAHRLQSVWRIAPVLGVLFVVAMLHAGASGATEPTREEILQLSDTVSEKKGKLSELQVAIDRYKRKIAEKEAESLSLANQVGLLENRIAKTQLDIESAELEIETAELEIRVLDGEIMLLEERIDASREMLADLLREIHRYDERSSIEILLGANRFSEVYAHLHFLEDVQGKLQGVVEEVRLVKATQEAQRDIREERRQALVAFKKTLEEKQVLLGSEQESKEQLFVAAQASEAHFQTLLRELREESQVLDSQVNALEFELSSRLKNYDIDVTGAPLFSWPHTGFITAYFHDPTYPYRRLFEHSGLDMRAAVGTPIKASAPGIVAIAQTGRSYGNYVVIIHANGYSTIYAHLSKILVKKEQFVERGDVIGLSGGCRGCAGAGLSTGPHLHFEIREQGIPVNPLEYLVDL